MFGVNIIDTLSQGSVYCALHQAPGLRTLLTGLPQYVPGGQMLPVSPSFGLACVAPPTQ